MVRAAAVALALLAPTAALADQFNLNCTGSLRSLAPAALLDTSEPYTKIYRLDLDAKKWCEADCKVRNDFASVSDATIVLEDKNVDTPREHDVIRNRISRETGEHSAMAEGGVGSGRVALFWKGQCEKVPFSGFPKVETKF